MAEEVIDPEVAGGTQDTAAETPDTTADTAAAPAADAPAADANADASAADANADASAADANADASAADANADASAADANADASAASTSGGTEYFNYEGIKSCFDELDAEFAAFAKTLETLNNTVQEKINVGPDSGVLGGYGTSIINLWNSNASTFGDFYKNFESWSATVISLANANGGFEGLTADMFSNHQSTGGTLDGVHDLRVTTAIGQGALRVDGQDIYDENNTITIGDFTYVRSIDEFGNTVIKKYDKNGNLVEVKLVTADGKNPELTKDPDTGYYIYTFTDENGKEVKYYYDDKGNVVQIEYTDENGVRHIITHTDENDNYNKDITEDYIWDEDKGEWVLDTSKQQEEAQAYIDSLKDPTTGEIDINNITQADLDKLSPEARQLVIDALADKFMEGFNNPTDAINAFGYDNFKNLPKELQEAIKARGDGSGGQQQEPEQTEGNPWDGGEEINDNNSFGGKTYKAEDGTMYYLDADGKLVSYQKDDTYYDAQGEEIGDSEAYREWLEDRNNGGGQGEQTSGNPWDGGTVQAETNSYGGQTIQGADGTTYYLDADGKLVASSKGDKYYAPDGTEIGNEEAYNNWLRDNGRPYSGNDEHGDYTATYENGTEIRTYERPDGSKTTREIRYDNNGKPQEIIDRDANGKETARIEYDRSGSRTETYQYDGYQVKKYYDANGRYTGSQHIGENGDNYDFNDENNDQAPNPNDGGNSETEYHEPELSSEQQTGGEYVNRSNEYSGGTTYKYTDSNGNLIYRYTDGKGNVVGYKVYTPGEVDNGRIIGTGTWYDSNGIPGDKPTNSEWIAQTDTPSTSQTGANSVDFSGVTRAGAEVTLSHHAGISNIVAVPTTFNEMKQAMANQQPIVIPAGYKLRFDSSGIGAFDIDTCDGYDRYLVYRDGKYYEADSTGRILDLNKGIDIARFGNGNNQFYDGWSNDSSYGWGGAFVPYMHMENHSNIDLGN